MKPMNHQLPSASGRVRVRIQTDGQELPEIGNVNGDPREYRDGSRNSSPSRASSGILPTLRRRVVLPQAVDHVAAGPVSSREFATLAHEVAHELMHRDERRDGTSKRIRETEAEAVAFVVCRQLVLTLVRPRKTTSAL